VTIPDDRTPLAVGSGGHGAIALITRATPRLAATIEMVNLCIESTPSSEPPNPASALKYGLTSDRMQPDLKFAHRTYSPAPCNYRPRTWVSHASGEG